MTSNTSDFRKIIDQLQASAGGGRGRRSELYRWLWVRADAFERLMTEVQPSWKMIATALQRLDIKDGSGKPPDPERCRKAWFAVRRAKGWTKPTRPTAAFIMPTSNPPRPSTRAQPQEDDDDVLLRAGDGTVFNPQSPT